MKIGIYGGTFNPIHKGHLEVAKHAIKSLELDILYFVPNNIYPFKNKKNNIIDVHHRINMINLVKIEKTKVSLFESNRKGVSYTIDTIKYFSKKFPEDKLFFIIGTDNINKLHKWENIDEISSLSKIVAFKRKGEFSKKNIKKYNVLLLNNNLFEYKSTDFRKGEFSNVDFKTMEYISKNFLYIKEILRNMVDAKRYKHCIATGHFAAELAKKLNLNAKKAWFAGITHDITKGMPKKWHRKFLEERGHFKLEDYQLHSLSGYYWLKDKYKCNDLEILNAVKVHTCLSKELTQMDKIIYVADKLCEGRKFPGIQKIRDLIFKDFNLGFKKLISIIFENLKINKKSFSKEEEEIYKKWIG